MAEQPPPRQDVPVFNPKYFIFLGANIGGEYLDANYLKFPVSQYARQTFNSGLYLANSSNITFTDGTTQATAATSSATPNIADVLTAGNDATFLEIDNFIADGATALTTPPPLSNDLQLATTAYTDVALTNYDTTAVISATYLSIVDAGTTYETIANASLLAPLASPALTGTPTTTTAGLGDNSSRIANTAFVKNQLAGTTTTNSVVITSTQVPQDATTGITNNYNNNSAYTINNFFVNYNNGATPTNTYKQNLGKVLWWAETPNSSNIYYSMTFEWSLTLTSSSSNSFAQPVNQAPSYTSSGLFSFMPYWLSHYSSSVGATSFTATQISNPQTVYIRWGQNSITNFPGSHTANAELTLDWKASSPNQLIFSYVNIPYSAGGFPGALSEWRADFNVRCLGKGGVPTGFINYDDYFLTLDPTELTGINVP